MKKLAIIITVLLLIGCVTDIKPPLRDPPEWAKNKDDRDLLESEKPIMLKPLPGWPRKAWEDKQNGWCLMKFTVTPEGFTKNIEVQDCSPKGYFEESCVYMISILKYPSLYDHDVDGVRNMCTWELQH